ncbi:ribosome maturation factor RimM [Selenomonas dianae]|uniref:ribosome maturation factor RimM n=1 Tax=Selenomonas dianae TaxID=135079 RepID=UPI00272ACD8C|nr:ribosome maturation factor RimM [Selenomonas dianae]WLD81620.1 ribosome maturation factor RimM [Selenomonas dianae]
MTRLSQSAPKGRIIIGRVGAAHGIHGDLRVIPLTDFPERFAALREVMVGDELLHVESARPQGKNFLMRFREYAVREDAQKLTGRLLTVARAEAAPLDEGEYYVFDIVGLTVCDEEDNELGTVEDVLRTGSNDVYAVRSEDGREILIPALRKVVRAIDVAGGRMTVRLPE